MAPAATTTGQASTTSVATSAKSTCELILSLALLLFRCHRCCCCRSSLPLPRPASATTWATTAITAFTTITAVSCCYCCCCLLFYEGSCDCCDDDYYCSAAALSSTSRAGCWKDASGPRTDGTCAVTCAAGWQGGSSTLSAEKVESNACRGVLAV